MKHVLSRSAVTLAVAVTSATTFAASPTEGTLTIDNRLIEFSEGPNVGVNVTPQAEPSCMDPALPCDHFDLTVDLPDALGEFYPQALIRMVFSWDDPSGSGSEDYDIYLYDSDGNLVNSSTTFEQPETMVQLAVGGRFDYRFDILFFTALGSTYSGRVELELGEPNPDKTPEEVDAFMLGESVVAQALNPDASVEASPRAAARYAGGSLGGGAVLLLALTALRRRRS